ncbi:hypothetical protein C8T65DRAFT_829273 [Cerioporus squamosus]|nr:hypothetical protein C8T65DRAFT_829273 [Cerioporus squamosus]
MFDGNPEFQHQVLDLAGSKLLNDKNPKPDSLTAEQLLACTGVRIPMGFNRTFISDPKERKLVSNHMRLLLFAGTEAAYLATVRQRWIDGKPYLASSPSMLPIHILGNHLLDDNLDLGGTRAEFVCAAVLLDARDCATILPLASDESPPGASPGGSNDGRDKFKFDGASKRRIVTVLQFLKTLIGESYVEMCLASYPSQVCKEEDADIPLKDAFQDAFVYFTHFIRVKSFELVNREYLLLAISRGAAVICADNHSGIDLVIPVLFGTEVKYRCGVFDKDVKDPRPVLRMVFALASDKAGVSTPARPPHRSQRQQEKREKEAEEEEDNAGMVTAYDIWFAGAFHETFAVIQRGNGEEGFYKTLLETIRDSRDVIPVHDEAARRAVRQMQPLTSEHEDHVELWADCTGNVGQQYPLLQETGMDGEAVDGHATDVETL